MPLDHIPEIIETGRWEGRAYEITEQITGGNLEELDVEPDDFSTITRIIDEIGRALDDFTKVGLRHRDLRPHAVLVRDHEPLDLVIDSFGLARLSDCDLDVVSPLETTLYMAPEAIAGGVAPASDWWSLGIIILEKATRGGCFEGVNKEAFLIHALANGVSLPNDLDPNIHLLLRGLLSRDRTKRWQWSEVCRWLNGEFVEAPGITSYAEESSGPSITLSDKQYHQPSSYTLAAADASNWDVAKDQLLRGEVINWAEEIGVEPKILSRLRTLNRQELDDDSRLALALKALNPNLPLVIRGDIVTPGWLLQNPVEGFALIKSDAPDVLAQMEMEEELWLLRLKKRAEAVPVRAANHDIELNREELNIHLLSTSKARLEALWEAKRKIFPDTDHAGLTTIIDRQQITDEDLIILLSASTKYFRSTDEITKESLELARDNAIDTFDESMIEELLQYNNRREILRLVGERTENFARCGISRVDEWVDQYRLERRMLLSRALALLTIPQERWEQPASQDYVRRIISFFEQKVTLSIKRGPLARMTIAKTTPRIDIVELGTERMRAEPILDHILDRSERAINLDPAPLSQDPLLEKRLRTLQKHATLYKRDTGIDGLYLGFPFLLVQPIGSSIKPRIAPVLLWPIKLTAEVGQRGLFTLAFDHEREEVRLNPALESFLGPEETRKWREQGDLILGGTVKAADVMDMFGVLVPPMERLLGPLPGAKVEITTGPGKLVCSAVLFHVAFSAQAVVEDFRQLARIPPAGTALESCLRIGANNEEQ